MLSGELAPSPRPFLSLAGSSQWSRNVSAVPLMSQKNTAAIKGEYDFL